MSGFEVIGLISGILSILDTVSKLYKVVNDAEGLPVAFRDIARRLPLVQDTLKAAEGHIMQQQQQNGADGVAAHEAIKPILESCREKAECLREILQRIAPEANESRVKRCRRAVRALGEGNRVEELMKGVAENAHLLAENRAVKAATEAQARELLVAIRELSDVPHSVPDATASKPPTVGNYEAGQQFINMGDGSQHINTGSGKQYIAGTMTFG